MIKPNVFLIGGSRCGTTALSQYLGEHPEISFSKPKGPGFFADDFKSHQYVKTMDDYHACFDEAGDEHKIVCEGSTWYLYSQTAVPAVLDYNPDAQFLVVLRSPVDQVHSFHNLLVLQGAEQYTDLKKAWDLQPRRKKGENIASTCPEPQFLQYADVARYGAQIEKLYGWVSADRVKVVIFDDLRDNPEATYRDVLSFLGLPDDHRKEFPVSLPNRKVRWPFLSRLVHQPSPFRILVANTIKRVMGLKSLGFSDAVLKANSPFGPRPEMTTDMQQTLCDFFKEDIDQLSGLLGRDLSHWYIIPKD